MRQFTASADFIRFSTSLTPDGREKTGARNRIIPGRLPILILHAAAR